MQKRPFPSAIVFEREIKMAQYIVSSLTANVCVCEVCGCHLAYV